MPMTRSPPPNLRSMGSGAGTARSYAAPAPSLRSQTLQQSVARSGSRGGRTWAAPKHDDRQRRDEREPGRDRDRDRDPAEPAGAVTSAEGQRLLREAQADERRAQLSRRSEPPAVCSVRVPEDLTGLRVAQR